MDIRKNKLIFISIVLIVFSVLAGCTSRQELVAKVNDEGITKIKLEENFNIQKMIIERVLGTDIWTKEMDDGRIYEDVVRESILQTLIKEALIQVEIEKLGIEIKEEEIEEQINQMRSLNGGEANFKEYLHQYDVTEENIRDVIRRGIIEGKYRDNILSQLDITDKDLLEFFNESKENFIKIRAMHILVETEEEAIQIIEELDEGKDFGQLAQERSIDPSAVTNSGDLDYFSRGDMVSDFEEVAFSLEVGKISEPVKTDFGYHIIKVIDRIEEFEDLKDDVNNAYQDSKFNDKIEELKSKSKIEIYSDKE